MADNGNIDIILNKYRMEIMEKSPKSYAIWQKNRKVMPAGVAGAQPAGYGAPISAPPAPSPRQGEFGCSRKSLLSESWKAGSTLRLLVPA